MSAKNAVLHVPNAQLQLTIVLRRLVRRDIIILRTNVFLLALKVIMLILLMDTVVNALQDVQLVMESALKNVLNV